MSTSPSLAITPFKAAGASNGVAFSGVSLGSTSSTFFRSEIRSGLLEGAVPRSSWANNPNAA